MAIPGLMIVVAVATDPTFKRPDTIPILVIQGVLLILALFLVQGVFGQQDLYIDGRSVLLRKERFGRTKEASFLLQENSRAVVTMGGQGLELSLTDSNGDKWLIDTSGPKGTKELIAHQINDYLAARYALTNSPPD